MDKAQMTMKLLLIFSLYLISAAAGGSRRVRGFSGGGVLIKCRYETQYTSNTKYFCKGSRVTCADQIKKDVKNAWVNSGRFSLIDNTSAAVFWVKIRDLTVEDSGTYQCASDINWSGDSYTPVELKVEADPEFGKSINVTGRAGGSVNISCKYPQSLRSSPKFFCRGMDSVGCFYKTAVKESGKWINQEKYSLHDDRVNNTLSVIISDVREGDSGEFWCGAESDWESDNGYKLYITHIRLTVTEQEQPVKTSAASTTPQTTATTTTTNTRESTSRKLASGFPASTVIAVVSVILVLLLIALLFCQYSLQKRRKSQASSPSKSLRGFSDDRKASLAEVEYEVIKNFGISTIYITANLPTDSSDPSPVLYDNVHLPTSLCDISNPIYSTAELPTRLSDSAEGLTYSKVNFSKKADGCDIVTMTTANKEQVSCEYATVRH